MAIKGKKSSGIDNIPHCVVKETEPYLRAEYVKLFNLAMRLIPTEWKMAKVSPIHKKGEVNKVSNYRPVSNLCSMSKFFEKIILKRINEKTSMDGEHQHGFRSKHSTTTAVLDIQRILAEELDKKRECMI